MYIWNVAGNTPVMVDSLIVENATTLGDIQVSDDGTLLIVATERANGSIVIYDLTNPLKPARLTRYQTANTSNGVHTAEVARVDGTLYAFLSIDPPTAVSDRGPVGPRKSAWRWCEHGNPFVHDCPRRTVILDTPSGTTATIREWWRRRRPLPTPYNRERARPPGRRRRWQRSAQCVGPMMPPAAQMRSARFVGEESSGARPVSTHRTRYPRRGRERYVAPREVAFYHVDGAGTHNFSVDEERASSTRRTTTGVRALTYAATGATTPGGRATTVRLLKMGRELAAVPPATRRTSGAHFDSRTPDMLGLQSRLLRLARLSLEPTGRTGF